MESTIEITVSTLGGKKTKMSVDNTRGGLRFLELTGNEGKKISIEFGSANQEANINDVYLSPAMIKLLIDFFTQKD